MRRPPDRAEHSGGVRRDDDVRRALHEHAVGRRARRTACVHAVQVQAIVCTPFSHRYWQLHVARGGTEGHFCLDVPFRAGGRLPRRADRRAVANARGARRRRGESAPGVQRRRAGGLAGEERPAQRGARAQAPTFIRSKYQPDKLGHRPGRLRLRHEDRRHVFGTHLGRANFAFEVNRDWGFGWSVGGGSAWVTGPLSGAGVVAADPGCLRRYGLADLGRVPPRAGRFAPATVARRRDHHNARPVRGGLRSAVPGYVQLRLLLGHERQLPWYSSAISTRRRPLRTTDPRKLQSRTTLALRTALRSRSRSRRWAVGGRSP